MSTPMISETTASGILAESKFEFRAFRLGKKSASLAKLGEFISQTPKPRRADRGTSYQKLSRFAPLLRWQLHQTSFLLFCALMTGWSWYTYLVTFRDGKASGSRNPKTTARRPLQCGGS